MTRVLRLLAIGAHPDDETLGFGGVLAKYAAEGVETHVVTATRGEKGWFGPRDDYPGPRALGSQREQEFRAGTQVLGVESVTLLDYIDGELNQADPHAVIVLLAGHIRRVRPHVVVTFGPDGIYGHPDHIAISQFTTAAVIAAADGSFATDGPPHRVEKLYYRAPSTAYMSLYEEAFGNLVMEVEGQERRSLGWADWLVTTRIDARAYWRQVWEAARCHQSQLPGYERLAALPDEHHEAMWGTQEFYRAFSLVNAPNTELDLFEGLRTPTNGAGEIQFAIAPP
jgi:LmbE family N-acetylglucosaminyl deacetylase